MPIYEFKCPLCENITEEVFLKPQGMSCVTTCKKCGSVAYRIPSSFAMHFVTDSEKIAKEKGLIRTEPGIKKQAADNKKHIEAKRKKEIRKVVEKSVMEFDLPA